LDAALDVREKLDERELMLSGAAVRARARGRPAPDGGELEAVQAELALFRSSILRAVMAAARQLLPYLPELVFAFPMLDPFHGTRAQGLPVREFGDYADVRPLLLALGGGEGVGGRHLMLRAQCPSDAGAGGEPAVLCVLKGFVSGDEKQLGRELDALRRLRHRNVMPLLGLCKQREPPRWFLQLPLFPQNLLQWLAARELVVGESKEDKDLAVGGMLAGVLEGIAYLHQVGTTVSGISPSVTAACVSNLFAFSFYVPCVFLGCRWGWSTATSSRRTCWSLRTAPQL